MATFASRVLFVAASAGLVDASAFLEAAPDKSEISRMDVQETLQNLLTMSSIDLKSLEEDMRPMFQALPKGKSGNLEHTTARYALHRYFDQKHGWRVNGLDPASDSPSNEAPTLLKDRAPSYIQELLEERMHGQGLSLHDMAVFAATLKSLVHQESTAELHRMFEIMNLPVAGITRGESDTYLVTHVLGVGEPIAKLKLDTTKLEKMLSRVFPQYHDTRMWVEDIRRSHDHFAQAIRNPFVQLAETFETTAAFLQEVDQKFGAFQNLECVELKNTLMDMDYHGTGRVLLRDFYSGFKEANFMFGESVDLLRRMGALDETDPKKISVVIPNYITSQSNCISSSGFYSVCCTNECEGLMRHVERDLAAASASPESIAQVISKLPSNTVDAPRNLSTALLGRLQEIANFHHGGSIPLYGRLFSQWMHHVYPRECPFPHVSGTTTPFSPSEWVKYRTNVEAIKASESEMQQYVDMNLVDLDDVMELPWVGVEEFVVDYVSSSRWSVVVRVLAAISLMASIVASLFKAVKAVVKPSCDKDVKYLV